MKWIGIIDDKLLSNFRVDYCIGHTPLLVLEDKIGFERGIPLQPLVTGTFVAKDGRYLYLSQEQVDCLIEIENRKMTSDARQRYLKDLGVNMDE